MLGPEFQKEIPLYMWVFPVDPHVPLPEIFLKYAKQAEAPVMLTPASIEANRERWIESWTEAVLR
jgi:thiamine transport system substrate-binding protein